MYNKVLQIETSRDFKCHKNITTMEHSDFEQIVYGLFLTVNNTIFAGKCLLPDNCNQLSYH